MSGIAGIFHHNHEKFLTNESFNDAEFIDSIKCRGKVLNKKENEKNYFFIETQHQFKYIQNQKESSNRDAWIVLADCRLDNKIELIDEFKLDPSLSDEDFLLELYKLHGNHFPKMLAGPFAFSIYNKKDNSIFIARDHFGQRPLFYACTKTKFIFSSAILSITNELKQRSPNLNKIKSFIISEEKKTNQTFFKNIHKLMPGHYLIIRQGIVEQARYFSLKDQKINNKYNENETIKKFYNIFEEVIKSQLKATNTNIASTLSGGLDSSSISLMLNKISINRNISAYSVNFYGIDDTEYKKTYEKNFVLDVIDNSNLQHKEINLLYENSGPFKSKNSKSFCHEPYAFINGYMHESIYQKCMNDKINYLFDGLFGDEVISHGFYKLSYYVKNGFFYKFYKEVNYLSKNKIIRSRKEIYINYIFTPLYLTLKMLLKIYVKLKIKAFGLI